MVDGKKVPFQFSMVTYGGSSEYETLAKKYREDLLSIGVKMDAVPLEWSAMLKKMDELDFDAYTGAWAPSIDTDLRGVWHSSQADVPQSSNRIGFKNPEADTLIEAHRRELDHDKRISICRQFHALIAEEQPYTFFYQRSRPMLYWDYMNEPLFTVESPYRDNRYFSLRQSP
jgi:ABC-type transport system substrate-binding protein